MASIPTLKSYFASIPEKNKFKLDQKLDYDHDGVQRDLGTIAESMYEWEGNVAEHLQLTKPEIEAIKQKHPRELSLQTRATLQKWQQKFGPNATYGALITAFVGAGKGEYAEAVCKVLGEQDHTNNGFQDPIQHYAMYLKGVYKSALVSSDKFPNLTCNKFINLALIKSAQICRSEADEYTKATLHGHIDEILQKKEPISLEEVLKPVEGQQDMKCVYMYGAPGVGKSTCIGELCKRWDKIEFSKKYSLVILLRLREKQVQDAKSVKDLCYHDNEEVRQSVADKIEACEGKDVLFILDGFDELPALLQKGSIFTKLIKGTFLSHCTVLVASRPSATADLYKVRPKMNKEIEVIGFTQEHIEQYVEAFFSSQPNVLANFLVYISTYPVIRSLMYIPLNCAITAEIYRHNRKSNRPIPQTMTQLYIELSLVLLQRHIVEDDQLIDPFPNKLQNLPEKLFRPFCLLAEQAFQGLTKQKVIFHDVPNSFVHFGFMNCPTELYLDRKDFVSHSFLHLTLQEFLAAFHISQLSPYDQQKVFADYYENAYWNVVWKFVAGLTGFHAIKWVRTLRMHVNHSTYHQYYDETSCISRWITPFLIQCLYEAQEKANFESDFVVFNADSPSLNTSLTELDCYAVGYCILMNGKCAWKLVMSNNRSLGDTLVKMLKHGLCFSKSEVSTIQPRTYINVQLLDLSYCDLTSTGFNLLADIVPLMTELKELNISHNEPASGGLVKLFDSLQTHVSHFKNLLVLNISDTKASCSDIEALSCLVSPSSSLKKLEISIKLEDSSSESSKLFLETVLSPSSLDCLVLCSTMHWTDKAVSLLEKNNNLTNLTLSFPDFWPSPRSLSLGAAVSKNSHLTTLTLLSGFRGGLTLDHILSLRKIICSNETLETIQINESCITQFDIMTLSTALQFNRTLKTIQTKRPRIFKLAQDQADQRICFF